MKAWYAVVDECPAFGLRSRVLGAHEVSVLWFGKVVFEANLRDI